jgi:hypothetical protein
LHRLGDLRGIADRFDPAPNVLRICHGLLDQAASRKLFINKMKHEIFRKSVSLPGRFEFLESRLQLAFQLLVELLFLAD